MKRNQNIPLGIVANGKKVTLCFNEETKAMGIKIGRKAMVIQATKKSNRYGKENIITHPANQWFEETGLYYLLKNKDRFYRKEDDEIEFVIISDWKYDEASHNWNYEIEHREISSCYHTVFRSFHIIKLELNLDTQTGSYWEENISIQEE